MPLVTLVVPAVDGGVTDFANQLQCIAGRNSIIVMRTDKTRNDAFSYTCDALILQYSGYGYSKRGAPVWLASALEKYRGVVGVYFHELYAFSPPWSSSFWLSPLQRRVARRLVQRADFWMTNREGSAHWLRGFAGDKPHAVLPVFSNVGETVEPVKVRAPRIVVFGSAGLRQATYKDAGSKLFAWAKQASLEIHDIGAPITDTQLSENLYANGVVMHGRLDEHDVSRLMKDALFGLLAYPVNYVAKSGVFAAYCAHGICPVLMSEICVPSDGLVAGSHYFSGVPGTEDIFDVASIGQAAWSWYQPHSVSNHVNTMNKLAKLTKDFA